MREEDTKALQKTSGENQSLYAVNTFLQKNQEEALKEKESMVVEIASLHAERDVLAKVKELALDANKQLGQDHQKMKEMWMKENATYQERDIHLDRVIDESEIKKDKVYHQTPVLM